MEPTVEAGKDPEGGAKQPLGPVIQIDEGRIQAHLDEVVRSTVEETVNGLLGAEAGELCAAWKYKRTESCKDTRAGSFDRRLQTRASEVTNPDKSEAAHPAVRNAIIERHRRRESSIEEALIEMYLARVNVRRVEDFMQALWETSVNARTVSDLNQKIYGRINEWRDRPLVGDFPSVFLTVSEGAKEDKASWTSFLRELKQRSLTGVQLFVSYKCRGLVERITLQSNFNQTIFLTAVENRKCEKTWTLPMIPKFNHNEAGKVLN
jgi:putative transposase